MSTYTGVIAASQKRCNCGAERLTDLFVQQQYMYLTSHPYALEHLDNIGGIYNVGVELVPPPSGTSAAGLSGVTFKATMIETVSYGEHKQPLSEAAGLSSMTFKASLITTVEYGEYKQPLSEAAGLANITFKATLKTQVIDVTVPPESTAGVFNVGVVLS